MVAMCATATGNAVSSAMRIEVKANALRHSDGAVKAALRANRGLTKNVAWQWYTEVYLWSPHWRRLRKAKLAAVRGCEDCGRVGALDAHHFDYRDLWSVTVDDLRALCRPCHDKRERNKRSFRNKAKLAAIEDATKAAHRRDMRKLRREGHRQYLPRVRALYRRLRAGEVSEKEFEQSRKELVRTWLKR